MERILEYWGLSILFTLKKGSLVATLTLNIQDDKFVGDDFVVHSPREGGYPDCIFIHGPCAMFCDRPFSKRMANVIAESGTNVVWEKIEEVMDRLSPEDFS